MRNIPLAILFVFLFHLGPATAVMAQNTMSPYSLFGPGEIQSKGFGRNMGMGRAGIALKTDILMNNLNPASYTGIDSLHFIFEMGINGKFSDFQSKGEKISGFNANLQYLAIGFRITDWWMNSFGLTPFSSVGYNIYSQKYVEGTNMKYSSSFSGSGGISLVYWANAFRITKNLSLGVNTSFLFGPLTQDEYIYHPDLNASYYISRSDYIRTLYFDYGLQYTFKAGNLDFGAGLIYANRQSLFSSYSTSVQNSSLVTIDMEEGSTGRREMPETAGIGLMMSKPGKYLFALDCQYQKWGGLVYPNMPGKFVDAYNFAAGAELKPWEPSVSNKFFMDWLYRFGANYYSSYLKMGGEVIDRTGISFGFGIPLTNRISALNISFEAGKYGTTRRSLIRERYLLVHANMCINEYWFTKRKYY